MSIENPKDVLPKGEEFFDNEWHKKELTKDKTLAENLAYFEEKGREATKQLEEASSANQN